MSVCLVVGVFFKTDLSIDSDMVGGGKGHDPRRGDGSDDDGT